MAAFFGNEGHVPLVSLHTKQMVGTLKMSGTARSGAFSADCTQLLTSGGDGTGAARGGWHSGSRPYLLTPLLALRLCGRFFCLAS